MALLNIDSFSDYDLSTILLNGGKFDNWRDEGAITIDGTYGRNGGPGLRLLTNSRQIGGRGNLTLHLNSNYETVIVGVAIRVDSDNQVASRSEGHFNFDKVLFSIMDGSTPQVSLCLTPSMRLRVKNGESGIELGRSTFYLHENIYYYIEIKCLVAISGNFTVRVDGITRLTGTGTTQSTVNQQANGIRLGSESSQPQTIAGKLIRYDDFYVAAEVAATSYNTFIGDVLTEGMSPISDGPSHQWSPSAGTLHYPLIDDATANTTDHVRAGTVGYVDNYIFSGVSVSSGSVLAVSPNIYARKISAGVARIVPVVTYQGTTTAGDDENYLTQEYRYHRTNLWLKRPDDDSQWALDFTDDHYIGVKRSG